jgi:hypothetical protein
MDFKYGEITEKIIRAAFRVPGTLGNVLREVIYQRANKISVELKAVIKLEDLHIAQAIEFHRFTI